MSFVRKTFAVFAAAVLVGVVAAGDLAAASSVTKVYVPANIIKGSAVTSGRTFYKSNLPENTLAGVRLGRPAKEVLAKWGNPSRITIGTVTTQPGGAPSSGGQTNSQTSSTGGNPIDSLAKGLGSIMGGPSGLPGLPGYGSPSENLPPVTGGKSDQQSAQQPAVVQEEVTWTYDLKNGITLEFIITDGLVTQITVGGTGPWSLSKTRTGLQLGDTYKLALWVCGYPEYQRYVGRFLRVSYVNKNRALFTFLNNKLVGVTIAIVPQELS